MTLTPLLSLGVAALAAASVVVFVWGLYLARTEQPVPADLGGVEHVSRRRRRSTSSGPLTGLVDTVGRPLAPLVLRIMGPARVAKLRRRINAAGRPKGMSVDVYATRKGGFTVLFGGVGVLLMVQGIVLLGVALIAAGFLWADLTLIAQARARQYEIERTLPDFLDVLTVTVTAGLGFRNALDRVCDSMPGALEEEFRTALRQMDVGTSRRDAFEELRARNSSEPLSQFITALLQAEELGSPLQQTLMEIAEDMRRDAAQAVRRKASRVTSRVSLILTTVMVPGVIVLLAGALLISQRSSFSGLFG